MVENIIVATSKWRESDIPTLFKDEDVTFTEQTLIPNLLKDLGVLSQLRKQYVQAEKVQFQKDGLSLRLLRREDFGSGTLLNKDK